MQLKRLVAVPWIVLLAASLGGASAPPPAELEMQPSPPQAADNPCAAVLSGVASSRATRATDRRLTKGDSFGADTRDVGDLLWPSRLAARSRPLGAGIRPSASQDVGDIAVIEDDGTLILQPNAFDLRGVGLRFEPNGAGYDVAPADAAFRSTLGRELSLGDDDATAETLPFPFPFYQRQFSELFVNSDGNLTFEEADSASTTRGFARLLGGPPRVAPFFADLDPSAGGHVFVDAAADAFTVTWCGVPGFESAQAMTVQVVLLPQGSVDIRFDAGSTLGEGLVALSPGRTGTFTPVDLSQAGSQAGGADAVGERFAESIELDLAQASRRFYETHPDAFDQLVFWTDRQVVTDAFAFESTVKNAISGIGVGTFDASRDFGSAGALESIVHMDRAAKYGDDPAAKINGESSTLAVLAHETGHRWLALLLFTDRRGGASDLLLGRQRAHWSFFVDSDASVMEGNDIQSLGGGAFRTVGASSRYSRLDLYAMGLAGPDDVPPWFYVEEPTNVVPARTRESAPRVGIRFNGTRRDVLIQDVIDVHGPREPAAADAPRLHRQAFIYVIQRGTTPNAADLTRIDRIRRQWEPFFSGATEERMTVRTTLAPVTPVTPQ